MTSENIDIVEELKLIRKDLDYIKEHMIDRDSLLSKEESKELNESIKNLKEGKTTNFDEFKKEFTS